ncbi:hypothetical protein CYY_009045 [Polysphondylium violaceum]|uniref:Uncharacterized protein n=1 Tax=Polysphondylium violaceum TaxID=133409 RepID=A0A8J4PKN9_9MYCE|nr:hypothetical protein CYY_009045 [Polysphondylium violaceum]
MYNNRSSEFSNSDNKTILFRSILNNAYLRKHVFKYFTPPTDGYLLYYNGKFYQDTDDYNLRLLFQPNVDESFIIDKLKRFKDIVNSDNSSHDSRNRPYYQDWLDVDSRTDFKKILQEVFINSTKKPEFVALVKELFSYNGNAILGDCVPTKDKIMFDVSTVNSEQEFRMLYKANPRYFAYKQVIQNTCIHDVFEFSQRVYHVAGDKKQNVALELLASVYFLAIMDGNMEFVRFYNKLWIDGLFCRMLTSRFDLKYFITTLLMAYCYSIEVYEYLVALLLAEDDRRIVVDDRVQIYIDESTQKYYKLSLFRLAIKRHDMEKVKAIYYSWSKQEQAIHLEKNTFDHLYAALANAKTFAEKTQLMAIGEFLKSEYLATEGVYPQHSSLIYVQDKAFYTLLRSRKGKSPLAHLARFIKGALFDGNFSLLKYLVKQFTPNELTSIDIGAVIKEYTYFTHGDFLKGILYLFEVFQPCLDESILDHLMHTAMRYNNHRLINILFHRTRVRLIQPRSQHHEQLILSRMKLMCKSSPHLASCTYFEKQPNFEIDGPLLDQETASHANVSPSIRYSVFKIDVDETIKTVLEYNPSCNTFISEKIKKTN